MRPTFRCIHDAGIPYGKSTSSATTSTTTSTMSDYCRARGVTPAGMLRGYLSTARRELGPDTFILSCWGVLPESVGLADACRIGGDGYGPVTMQQYNFWNGIVWRNDPDHCDRLSALQARRDRRQCLQDRHRRRPPPPTPSAPPSPPSPATCSCSATAPPQRRRRQPQRLRCSAPVLFQRARPALRLRSRQDPQPHPHGAHLITSGASSVARRRRPVRPCSACSTSSTGPFEH
ncbi:MAG: hypothetical protein U1F87_04175 [Kiritimatiellia bacterium]